MGALIAFLGIIIMIILHEWGHFIAARIFKVPVYEFAIGMGPRLLSHKGKKGTIFSLRALPIGGFCAFDDTENSGIEDFALEKIPIFQKILICVAGPFINLITGLFIFFMLVIFIGASYDTNTVISILDNYPSYGVLQENDKIISINNIELNEETTLSKMVKDSNGVPLEITFIRNKKAQSVTITPKYDKAAGRYYIGVNTALAYKKANLKEVFTQPFALTIASIKQIFGGLFGLISGQAKLKDMSGLIGIVSYANEYATLKSIYTFFSILAMVSINLGIMNLLPIPGLDGSKILGGFFQIIFKKKLPEKIQTILINTSFALLIGFMIIVAINDVIKIFFN